MLIDLDELCIFMSFLENDHMYNKKNRIFNIYVHLRDSLFVKDSPKHSSPNSTQRSNVNRILSGYL